MLGFSSNLFRILCMYGTFKCFQTLLIIQYSNKPSLLAFRKDFKEHTPHPDVWSPRPLRPPDVWPQTPPMGLNPVSGCGFSRSR